MVMRNGPVIRAPAFYNDGSRYLSAVDQGFNLLDNQKAEYGTGQDATAYYDGTNFIIEPRAVGSGNFIINDACILFLNETLNGDMTVGLTINQGANDDHILALKSSDVAHGVTTQAETDTYAAFKKASGTAGGLMIMGFSEANIALTMFLVATTEDTTKTISGLGITEFTHFLKSGTGVTNIGADVNLMAIKTRSGGNTVSRFLFDTEGSGHADVEWVAFDKHDDIALLSDIEAELLAMESPRGTEHRHMLEQTGIIGADSWHIENGKPRAMINFTRLAMLHHGALLQVGERMERLETENRELRALMEAA